MGEIIDRLAAEPAIRYVYLTPVARPSFLGDLPPDGGEAPVGLGHDDDRYKVDFTLGRTGAAFHGITGNDVRAADRLAADTNQKLRDLVARANARAKRAPGDEKFVVVPLEQGFDHYDFKHTGVVTDSLPLTFRPPFPASIVDRGHTLYLTNLPVRIELTSGRLGLVPRFVQGGLFSFDNMHLSTFGYDLLADQVATAIEAHEHLAPSPDGLAATLRPDAIFSNPDPRHTCSCATRTRTPPCAAPSSTSRRASPASRPASSTGAGTGRS